jgi:hypothetical protein
MSRTKKKSPPLEWDEAIQYTGNNMREIMKFAKNATEFEEDFLGDNITIKTPEGTITAERGGWIIRGIGGELHSCKQAIFERMLKK